jgi:hypothetical protein
MKIRILLAAAIIASPAMASLAYADDIETHTVIDNDDTTGSIVVQKRQPTVVIERQQPTVVIKKQQPDVVIHQNDNSGVDDDE